MQFYTNSVSDCMLNYNPTCNDNRFFGATHSDPVYNCAQPVASPATRNLKRRCDDETAERYASPDHVKRAKAPALAFLGNESKRVTFDGVVTSHLEGSQAVLYLHQPYVEQPDTDMGEVVSHLHPSGDVELYIINGYHMSYPSK